MFLPLMTQLLIKTAVTVRMRTKHHCFYVQYVHGALPIFIIMPVLLLYATEACLLLSHDKQSLEFTLTRLFMKIFRTASPAVVIECQRTFGLLPITLQILIRTAKFLQVFVATDNSLCQLFHCSAVNLLKEYNVHTAGQLANRVYDVFTAAEQ